MMLDGPRYRLVEVGGDLCLFLAQYNTRIATFVVGARVDAEKIVDAANRATSDKRDSETEEG